MNHAHKTCECGTSVAASFSKVLELSGVQSRPNIEDTPKRYAKFLSEALHVPPLDFRIFDEEEVGGGMLVQDGIFMSSLCEHHTLPFFGTCSIGYLPSSGRVCGLSKLTRIVQHFSAGLQIQERIAYRLAEFLFEKSGLNPIGVGVSLRCYHTCMLARGVRQPAAVTTVQQLRGAFHSDPQTRSEFLQRVAHPSIF